MSSNRKIDYAEGVRIENLKEQRMSRRYALTDEQWERLEPLLPGRKRLVGRPTKDNRLFIEAVLCLETNPSMQISVLERC